MSQTGTVPRWLTEKATRWTNGSEKEQDKSTNRDEGSYQLPHIYDCLLFATATVILTMAAATKTINVGYICTNLYN